MKCPSTLTVISAGVIAAIFLPQLGHTQSTQTGTIERVWDDGLRLQTGEQTLWVDASDLYDNNTPSHIEVGDQVSVTGKFGQIEFNASTISVVPTKP
ncbi:MAG: hypothetical protein QNJ46_15400 [Leptolyngbyaceae cyanobacterium MO_188.B28]|nr:hypothetical protein [Leptolyngbyaceae cyanobacterium MO_188.B28]